MSRNSSKLKVRLVSQKNPKTSLVVWRIAKLNVPIISLEGVSTYEEYFLINLNTKTFKIN